MEFTIRCLHFILLQVLIINQLGLISCQDAICNTLGDIVFVIDSSGSINDRDPGNWDRVKSFAKNVVNRLKIGPNDAQIGIVKYSTKAYVEFPLDGFDNSNDLNTAIDNMRYLGGNTNTSGGLWLMREEVFSQKGDRSLAPNTAIVITDGVSTYDPDKTVPYADDAKRDGIKILAVGITNQVNYVELLGIASNVSYVYNVTDFTRLSDIIEQLLQVACVTRPPTTTPALQPPLECREPVDLIFVLDASGSIEFVNFEKMRNFVMSFVEEIDVESDVARIGLLLFSDNIRLEFNLNEYNSRLDIIEHIQSIPYTRGSTNTAAALQYVTDNMFTQPNGDRNNARNIAFLVTDGQSNNRENTMTRAKSLKDKGIHLFVAGVGDWLDEMELEAIVSYPSSRNLYRLDNFDNLDRNFRTTFRETICNNINECASNPCRNSVTCNDALGYYWCLCLDRWGGVNCDRRCEEQIDLVFALDASGSIGRQNFEIMIEFVRNVIQGLRIGTPESSRPSRVGLMTYSNNARLYFDLNDYGNKYDILNALPPFYTGGTTNTAGALRYMRENMFTSDNGDQPGVQNIGIVLTDGKSDDEEETWKESVQSRQDGIDLISIGVGSSTRRRELEAIASDPVENNVFMVDNFGQLEGIQEAIINSLCDNVNECNSNPCRNGGTCVDLINGYVCRCPSGYTGIRCERRCDGAADIVFVFDASGSIHRERFPLVLDFAKQIITALEVNPQRTRVAAVKWSNNAEAEFYLNTYNSKQDVIQAVQYTQYLGDRTNTASALRLMRTEIFQTQNGDRDTAPNYAIVITDGNSNINEAETYTEAVAAKVSGIHVMVVSVGQQINTFELKAIASDPDERNIFQVERISELPNLISQIPGALCNDRNECNSSPCRGGGQCIDMLGGFMCFCQEGRVGEFCESTCRRQFDVVFMLDLSGSVQEEYERTIAFTKRVIYGLDMAFDRTRFGVVTFGDTATIQFDLNAYRAKQEVLNALSFFPNMGKTNTQAALGVMRRELFSSGRGDRTGVDNIAILVTDGYSNIDRFNTIPEAERAKNDGIAVYVVAIGQEIDPLEIQEIAGESGEPSDSYVLRVQNDQDLDRIAEELTTRLCQ